MQGKVGNILFFFFLFFLPRRRLRQCQEPRVVDSHTHTQSLVFGPLPSHSICGCSDWTRAWEEENHCSIRQHDHQMPCVNCGTLTLHHLSGISLTKFQLFLLLVSPRSHSRITCHLHELRNGSDNKAGFPNNLTALKTSIVWRRRARRLLSSPSPTKICTERLKAHYYLLFLQLSIHARLPVKLQKLKLLSPKSKHVRFLERPQASKHQSSKKENEKSRECGLEALLALN